MNKHKRFADEEFARTGQAPSTKQRLNRAKKEAADYAEQAKLQAEPKLKEVTEKAKQFADEKGLTAKSKELADKAKHFAEEKQLVEKSKDLSVKGLNFADKAIQKALNKLK